ncbi:MAG TPA: TauD/TfdA family dioxygenase [Acidimicrobiia bacterium]|nr:TauD/TfdA family dioxygenase [Acidimicrobiia bacterium]
MAIATDIEIRPLSGSIGAEVQGVDLASELDDEVIATIRALWLEHLVLFFPDQDLTPDRQQAFAARFGEVTAAHPVEPALEGHPRVLPVDSASGQTDFWHTDVTFMARPPMASLLYAVQLPPAGGDTMWANMRVAYETLAEPLRRLCDELSAYHYAADYAEAVENGDGKEWEGAPVKKMVPVEHPVVRVHPETGQRALFVNPGFTALLKGFNGPQSQDLLRLLYKHATQPELICRYHWKPGSVAFWDNRATMHYGVHDYGTARRIMHRVTLQGDRPFGPSSPKAATVTVAG